jgi:hypothetical protein
MGEQLAIPAYDGSVFISYARTDDVQPPFDRTTLGWVTFFCENLRFELTNVGVHQADLWVDRYKIEPAEKFTKKIAEALAKARLILPILSPNWIQREWCRKEVISFLELDDHEDDDIVLVKKLDAPDSDIPAPLRNREGYKFYVNEPTGAVREFYWRGLQDEAAYYNQVKRVAEWIAQRFITESKQEKAAVPRKGRTVYLAAPADEMRDAWQRLANDLEGAGYDVLPVDGRLPDTVAKAEEAVLAALAHAELIVHLLGEIEGVTLAGGTETLARLQLRVTREHGMTNAPVPRVLWAPKWLPDSTKERRDPFNVVGQFGGISPGEEVYGEEVTNLSQWLRSRLDPPLPVPMPAQAMPRLIVIAAAAEDNGDVNQLANRLQASDIRVRPLYAGSASPVSPQPDEIALILWGAAGGAAIDKLLGDLMLARERVFMLRLPEGDLAAKRMFFVDGVIVEDLPGLPGDRRSARELLERLEIVAAVGRRSA